MILTLQFNLIAQLILVFDTTYEESIGKELSYAFFVSVYTPIFLAPNHCMQMNKWMFSLQQITSNGSLSEDLSAGNNYLEI